MGQKVNPIGIRLGITRDWVSKWYAGKRLFAQQIYTDYQVREFLRKKLSEASVSRVNIERSARNGIAPVAGEVSILGGHVYNSGLHGIDFEVNNDKGAASVKGVVDGVDIRRVQDLPAVGFDGYAIAAGGYSSATKQSMIVRNVTGDLLNMTIRDTAEVTVTGNVSDVQAIADFPGSDLVTFSDNVRITRE
jgi:hypothetical protein